MMNVLLCFFSLVGKVFRSVVSMFFLLLVCGCMMYCFIVFVCLGELFFGWLFLAKRVCRVRLCGLFCERLFELCEHVFVFV